MVGRDPFETPASEVKENTWAGGHNGGSFYFYPWGPGSDPVSVASKPNSAIVLNGVNVMHGADRWMPGTYETVCQV